MITKNEEKYLGRCLESVRGLVSEIIIADTGSIDRTIEIGNKYGATLLNFPWVDDYAAARNFSIENASGGWILIMDADDELEENSKMKIKSLLDNAANVDGYSFLIFNVGFNNLHSSVRLFRNQNNLRYTRPIHEIVTNIDPDRAINIESTDLRIIHHGYDIDEATHKIKLDKRLALLKKEYALDPDNVTTKYYLAEFYSYQNDHEKAVELCMEILGTERLEDPTTKQLAFITYIHALGKLMRFKDIVSAIQENPEYSHSNPMILYYYGIANSILNDFEEAILAFNNCLNFDLKNIDVGRVVGDLNRKAKEALLMAYFHAGKKEETLQIIDEILHAEKENETALKIKNIIYNNHQ